MYSEFRINYNVDSMKKYEKHENDGQGTKIYCLLLNKFSCLSCVIVMHVVMSQIKDSCGKTYSLRISTRDII